VRVQPEDEAGAAYRGRGDVRRSGRLDAIAHVRTLLPSALLGRDTRPLSALVRAFDFEPRYNVCPTQTIHAVVEHDGARDIVPMRWGLVPV
jgi:putative SOS response-associated peptidase YedK